MNFLERRVRAGTRIICKEGNDLATMTWGDVKGVAYEELP